MRKLVRTAVLGLTAVLLTALPAHASWPTTCVELNDLVKYRLGNHGNIGIYERVFGDPETFDIFREDLYIGREMRVGYREGGRSSHIGFGLGKHFCAGYQLARTEAVVGTRMILEAIADVRIKPGHNPVMGGNAGMRSVTSLDLEFDPA